jgi:hypothetical protein
MSTKPTYGNVYFEPPPNPSHKKQKIWQIWVPLGFAILLMLALVVWAALATAGNPVVGMEWAAISIVFLSLPAMLIGLIILVILAGLIYLVSKLLGVLPYYSLIARTFVYRTGAKLIGFMNALAKPVLFVNGIWAGWLKLLERLQLRKSR